VLIGHRPQAADDAEMIRRLDRQRTAYKSVESIHDLAIRIGIQSKDRTEVHCGGVKEFQTVRFGSGQCLLVGIDTASAERFQADARQKTAAGIAAALDFK